MKVGIVGGGVLGITLGYALARAGAQVDVFEAAPALGGLVSTFEPLPGVRVDRFYHTVLRSDQHVQDLCAELGLADRLTFRETRTGLYHEGRLYSLNTLADFLLFPPLGWVDRARLGYTALYAQLLRDWHSLEGVPVAEWLERLGGRRTVAIIWRAMLRAKFDGGYDDIPATYIWSRLVRTRSARGGAAQKEGAGYLPGGYLTLLEAMVACISETGGQVRLGSPVEEIVQIAAATEGLRVGGETLPYEAVVAAVPLPALRRLLPDADADYVALLERTDYLDLICPVLVLDRPLTGYWTLNISDERIPFTGIIETTSYIDPAWVGGNHLVYLPKYVARGSRWQSLSDAEIRDEWLGHLQAMFPSFRREWIRAFAVQRASSVEPLHRLNGLDAIPPIATPYDRLFLATTAQIYPALTNVESVTRHALDVSRVVLRALQQGTAPAGQAGQAALNVSLRGMAG